ncbi:MAG: hypothetical protein PWQ91_1124 [Eubacteriales bacterium]|nr:hypothetical protein [Eubacteriales bacterium]MDN5364063.1 hypothetical protein [Eubacteriales bacterium]
MKNQANLLLFVLLGAGAGWLANFLLLRSLFYPRRPVTVPFFNFTLWGLLPRRQEEVARLVGKWVEKEFLGPEGLLTQLEKQGITGRLQEEMVAGILRRVKEKIPALVPGVIRDRLLAGLEKALRREIQEFMQASLAQAATTLEEKFPVGQMVENRIRALELLELERTLHRETVRLPVIGGVIGALLGVLFWLLDLVL